jgi:hypothetical protein
MNDENSAGKPHAGTRLVKFLDKRILELRARKTQGQIASEVGLKQANMLTMIKSGTSKDTCNDN